MTVIPMGDPSAVKIAPIPADQIAATWGWLGDTLRPAIDRDKDTTEREVRLRLSMGLSSACRVTGEGVSGAIVTRMAPNGGGKPVAWVQYAAGSVTGGPKAVRATLIAILQQIEAAAKSGGAGEIRILGRFPWKRVCSDYEVVAESDRVELRKAL